MKQTEWKIIYTRYEGVAKSAINLLSKEAGGLIIREEGEYSLHVLPCEKEGAELSKNAFFVSRYEESTVIQGFVSKDEIPKDGYIVRIVKNPEDEDGRFVILTSHTDTGLFLAVASFLDEYIPTEAPKHGWNKMPDKVFDSPLAEFSRAYEPDNKTRSIFTWGHSINDFRLYLDNMARLKFNEIVIWNDYIPINIRDIIDYAHSLGIRIILGYSWGWREIGSRAKEISEDNIARLSELVIREYREEYAPIGCDGIYFQSFTERNEERVGGKLIATLVTDMVNSIAKELWKITPGLRLIFGLHATSVRESLSEIAKLDTGVEILWEDAGEFPYHYHSYVHSEDEYEKTLEFTKKLLELRGGVGVGLVFKGVMMLDWRKFVYQRGPYVMGESSERISAHDRRIRAAAWREYTANWTVNGDRVLKMMKFIKENKLGEVNMCLAGTFDGGIYLPTALCAEMFCDSRGEYSELLSRVAKFPCIAHDKA